LAAEIKDRPGQLGFGVTPESLDLAKYVSKNDAGKFKLVLAIRAKSATPHNAASYPMAFGFFPFDNISPQIEPKSEEIKKVTCVEFVLFRIPNAQADQKRFKLPFSPSDYGNDVKVLNSAYDGDGCG
jgi:hypothetical protein